MRRVLAQRPERYLRAPRLVRGGEALRVVAWRPAEGLEQVLEHPVGDAGALGPEAVVHEAPAVPALDDAGAPADASSERRAEKGGWRVRVVLGAVCEVRATPPGGQEVLVWAARGTAAAPAVAATAEGAWVAWHHDVREDTGAPDVAKWIALRFVRTDGKVLAPAAPMRDRDRDLEGEEQGFEFPALAAGADGALALVGRGSHARFLQHLDARGFGPRRAIGEAGWGCRGRRASLALRGDHLLVAHREREGIAVDVLPAPRGGPPALVPAPAERPPVPRVPGRRRADPAAAHGLRTYFGDIQQHSAHSDGVGSAEEVYLRARHRYGDDFVALTDHESFLGKRIGPGEWAYLQDVADAFEDPGAFATLLAYEWTGKRHPGPGHKCVYVPERRPILSRDVLSEGRALVEAIAAQGGFASPHHVGWTGADAAGHTERGQPLWEICSCHGCYEHPDHPLGQRGELAGETILEMLRRGLRFGFSASSDSHGLLWHHGESRKRDPYRTGLTAVQAPRLDRASVFEALRSRRCYATSGTRILLDATADGRPMGSFLGRGPFAVSARALGTARLARMELVGPGGVLAHGTVDGAEGTLEARVDAPFAYVRVVQTDGEMAWASPFFAGARVRPWRSPHPYLEGTRT
ncbi:MAG: DUF3604 domain-containing protein [Myxococcota bacterium]